MLYGNKLNNDSHFFGNKLRKDIKFGAKHMAKRLHKVNDLAVPTLALSGMPALAGGLKTTEALLSGLGRI
jgi:hypothetical protein